MIHCLTLLLVLGAADTPFYVRVVDAETGRGVPLVSLRTTNEIIYYTDSQGIAAIDEPGLEGLELFLHVASPGYEFPADGFGNRGRRVRVERGSHAEIHLPRKQLAERLYRITGGGIYRDSVLAGLTVPLRRPVLNGQVFGCDSVASAVYQGRLFWLWGDTNRPSYPLGNFHMTGAVSDLPQSGGLPIEQGVDFDYFTDESGFARGMAPLPGAGPTWLDGLTVLVDGQGRERMFAGYAKIKPPLEVYERGLVEWDATAATFRPVCQFDERAVAYLQGHPLLHVVEGIEYVYFAKPFPLLRVRATPEALADPAQYEAYTCLTEGSRLDAPVVNRDAAGRARYAWRRNAPVVDAQGQHQLEQRGHLQPDEGLLQVRDVASGEPVRLHNGSTYFNRYRNCWVLIANQMYGKDSVLGEVWYAEAPEPTGPWTSARQIATHPHYSFYNPKQHPMLSDAEDRIIYFEGTYTTLFSGNKHPTPRYEYNQLLYRLDLEKLAKE